MSKVYFVFTLNPFFTTVPSVYIHIYTVYSKSSKIDSKKLNENSKQQIKLQEPFREFLIKKTSAVCFAFAAYGFLDKDSPGLLTLLLLEFSRICVYCIPYLNLFLYDVYFI